MIRAVKITITAVTTGTTRLRFPLMNAIHSEVKSLLSSRDGGAKISMKISQ